jgi:hypothetical protein
MIETKDLTLTVEKQVPGELVTNALAIEAFVAERIKDFTPEKYFDDPEQAKKDRAVLNNASKDLNGRRLSLEREFMEPFEPVKAAIKRATDMLNTGAVKLGEVWNAVEETIKAEKRKDIEALFAKKSFALVPLDQIFDQRWLNKGVSMKVVDEQLSEKIKKIYDDIKVIEALPSDVAEVKAQYLDSLDIGSALATAQRLKANRDRIAAEEQSRSEREHAEHMDEQVRELAADAVVEKQIDETATLVAEALEEEIDPLIHCVFTYGSGTIEFDMTRALIIALRQWFTSQGVEYRKI